MKKERMGRTYQPSYQDFVNKMVCSLTPVGSREVDIQIDSLRAGGVDIIKVYGYPIVDPPPHVQETAARAASSTVFAPSNGLLELREALAEAILNQYGQSVDPESEILITIGGMHALHVVFTALLDSTDEALVISPSYFFDGLIRLTGASRMYAEMSEEAGYCLDFQKIRSRISSRTKLIVVNSPVNPTGYLYSQSDVEQLIALAEEHDLLLVSDESYDRMLYDGQKHHSPFAYPEGKSRTILVKSFTKSYAIPTWRVGYIVTDAGLNTYFRKILEWTVLHCPYVNQRVALAALEGPQEWLQKVGRDFQASRDLLIGGIRHLENFSFVTPRGGPFLFLNVSRYGSGERVAQEFLSRYGIPAVAGSYFNSRDHVRIPFGGTNEAVSDLINALTQASVEYVPQPDGH